MRRKVWWWILGILGLILLIGVGGELSKLNRRGVARHQSEELAQRARSQVSVGMSREEAISVLQVDAWHHATCEDTNQYIDLFLYGSHDLRLTGIALTMSERESDGGLVTFIGAAENYRLFLYDRRSSLDLTNAPQSK